MGRGLGSAQKAILDILREHTWTAGPEGLTVAEITTVLSRPPCQIRTAAHKLADRGLVLVNTDIIGWRRNGRPISGLVITLPGMQRAARHHSMDGAEAHAALRPSAGCGATSSQ